MAQENWQKYKLLKLLELLRQETDEQNPLPFGRPNKFRDERLGG